MIALDSALASYARHLAPLPVEWLPPEAAAGRVLAEAVQSLTDLPRLDQSAMDGYALRAADTAGGGRDTPVRLRVTATVAARAQPALPVVEPGCAARIFTGGLIPPGADVVIAQERAQREGDELVLTASWPVGRNIRRRGDELRAGTQLAEAGQRIGPGLLASLVNGAVASLPVRRAPRVAVFVTGDELRPAGSPLAAGEIHDSNGPMVRAWLARRGCVLGSSGHLGDDPEAVRAALARALATHDLVLTCGGASVGDKDYVPSEAEAIGVQRVFWKVAQKPGKPLFFGVRPAADGGGALIALPGNPGAVFAGLLLHVATALDVLEGAARPGPQWQPGRLLAPVERDHARTRLVRMRLVIDHEARAGLQPLPYQDSHMLSNLDRADVLVRVEPGEAAAEAGTRLDWLPLAA